MSEFVVVVVVVTTPSIKSISLSEKFCSILVVQKMPGIQSRGHLAVTSEAAFLLVL